MSGSHIKRGASKMLVTLLHRWVCSLLMVKSTAIPNKMGWR